MGYYALLNYNNIVTRVLTARSQSEIDHNLEIVYQDIYKQVCKKTSKKTKGGVHVDGGTPFRKNYAGIGFSYDESRDAFIPPKPFESWTLNESTCLWEAPVSHPTDGNHYEWNEDDQQWDLIS